MCRFLGLVLALLFTCCPRAGAADRPNILWLTCEDMGPHLGCYGDTYATTPNLDKFATRSLRYLNVWSNAPVCAPARTTIISGMYPTSTGAEHMRSMVSLPAHMKFYPQYLREAGYYCTNNNKEDYNLVKPGQVWDESSGKAHYKNRKPGQPFFAIFNVTVTHESQIRRRPHKLIHDPAKVRIPAYHPDTPEVRHDWAQYYDNITTMDRIMGERLKELEDAGLAKDTIVFFYSDHGSGMPRSKRWPYNSGLHVPMLIHFPEKWKHLASKEYTPGHKTDRLVGFVDLAPTVLSLAWVKPPEYYQGRAFLGKFEAKPNEYLHGFRGRMDERYDLVRSVRDKRYVFIHNYMPHKPYGQHVSYMFETPTTQVWKRLFDAGKLNKAQARFWQTKPTFEFYDLQNDPDEIHNLSEPPPPGKDLPPNLGDIFERLRLAQGDHMRRILDLFYLPEDELHNRSRGTTPYEMARDKQNSSMFDAWGMAWGASQLGALVDAKFNFAPMLQPAMDSGVRYWAAMGILMRGKEAVVATREDLRKALADASPSVRVVAAEALGRYGNEEDLKKSLDALKELVSPKKNGLFVSVAALNALGELGEKARPVLAEIQAAAKEKAMADPRYQNYVPRLVEKLTADLKRE